jgi:PKD repeat protein
MMMERVNPSVGLVDDVIITVNNVAPIADADVSQNIVDEGTPVDFFGSQIDPGADTFTYVWTFGDGGTSNEQNPTHPYADNGVYTVTLTVTDDDGGIGVDTLSILVNNVPPLATATVDQNPANEGVDLTFTGDGTDPGADTLSYHWEFGDGESADGQVVTHPYMDNGCYVATLQVTDDDGDSDTTWIILHINDLAPTADAGPDRTVALAEVVVFDGSGSSSYPDSIVSYEWDFGDGDTALGMVVTNSFDAVGTYTVTLTVTDDDGSIDSDTALVTVLVPGVELMPSDVVFSPANAVDVGVTVTVSGKITNYGNTDAASVIVRFYEGNPDNNGDGKPDMGAVQIGSDQIYSIPSGQSVNPTVLWTSSLGYHTIYVWADPDNFVPEYDETNNLALNSIIGGSDLVPSNIVYTPSSPTAVGTIIGITADVTNRGGTAVTNVLVRFYLENPDSNNDGFEDPAAVQIDDATIPSLAPGQTATTPPIQWTPSAADIYDIWVWVDPAMQPNKEGAILEAIETNNLETSTFSVGPDLSISFMDITFSDNPVAEGTMVSITVVIHNQGGEDAFNVAVDVYDNEIKKKALIESKIPRIGSIAAGDTYTWTLSWVSTGVGYHNIWVVIDSKNDVLEYDESNNEAYNVLSVT